MRHIFKPVIVGVLLMATAEQAYAISKPQYDVPASTKNMSSIPEIRADVSHLLDNTASNSCPEICYLYDMLWRRWNMCITNNDGNGVQNRDYWCGDNDFNDVHELMETVLRVSGCEDICFEITLESWGIHPASENE